MSKAKYIIVAEMAGGGCFISAYANCAKTVNAKMKEGYVPLGNLFYDEHNGEAVQAMVLKPKEDMSRAMSK